jgi:hypothetical protein
VLEGCKLKGFQVDALQGGSVKILYTVQAANVSERAFGKLCTLIDCEVSLMMVPPDEEQPSLPIATVGGEPAAIVTH